MGVGGLRRVAEPRHTSIATVMVSFMRFDVPTNGRWRRLLSLVVA